MIKTEVYIHPYERYALEEMRKNALFSEEIMDYYEKFSLKLQKPDLLGKTVTITSSQFPIAYNMVASVSQQLDMVMPPVYVYEDFYYGVEAKGADDTWIEISAKTLVDFDEEELLFLISRELCAIKLRHTYYQTLIDESFSALTTNLVIPGSDAIIKTLRLSMYRWSRLSNYTEDCFGYLICQNLKPCVSAILKLVLNNVYLAQNVNVFEYLKQADAISALNDTVQLYTKMDERIPYGPFRMKYLISYMTSGRGTQEFTNI